MKNTIKKITPLFFLMAMMISPLGVNALERISVGTGGLEVQQNSFPSSIKSITSDARYFLFRTSAANILEGPQDGVSSAHYLLDRDTDTVRYLEYVDETATISDDGRYIVFLSFQDIPGTEEDGLPDFFILDTFSDTYEEVPLGVVAPFSSSNLTISSDASVITFSVNETDLVPGDTSIVDIIRYENGEYKRITENSLGDGANSDSSWPAVSAEGQFITFTSDASNLVEPYGLDPYDSLEVFLYDNNTETIERITYASSSSERSVAPSVSSDGKYVVFSSNISNLVDNDTNEVFDVFVHNTETGEFQRISVDIDGNEVNGNSLGPRMSSDGRYIIFESESALVPEDTNLSNDVYVYDLLNAELALISISSEGVTGNADSATSYISPTGEYIVFSSFASNLIENDTNEEFGGGRGNPGGADVFLAENPLFERIIEEPEPEPDDDEEVTRSSGSSTIRYCSSTITSFCRPTTSAPVVTPTETNPFNGDQCPASQLLTNNMKQGDRNGTYSSYNNGLVTQVNLLQAHINRVLGSEYTEAAGPIDGIFGPQTKLGVERLQQRLNTLLNQNLTIDGIVGPLTRSVLNTSC